MLEKNFDKNTIQGKPKKDVGEMALTAKLLYMSVQATLWRVALKLGDLLKNIGYYVFPSTHCKII